MKYKYAFMDQDGELYANPDNLNTFTNHYNEVHPTETDSSHQHQMNQSIELTVVLVIMYVPC